MALYSWCLLKKMIRLKSCDDFLPREKFQNRKVVSQVSERKSRLQSQIDPSAALEPITDAIVVVFTECTMKPKDT